MILTFIFRSQLLSAFNLAMGAFSPICNFVVFNLIMTLANKWQKLTKPKHDETLGLIEHLTTHHGDCQRACGKLLSNMPATIKILYLNMCDEKRRFKTGEISMKTVLESLSNLQ